MNFALDFKRAHANQSKKKKKKSFSNLRKLHLRLYVWEVPIFLGFQNLSTSHLLVNLFDGAKDVRKQLLKGSLLGFKFEAKEKTV